MDKLMAYLKGLPRGERSKFARRAGLCPTYLWRIENGYKGVGLTVACRLVEASEGALTLDDFVRATNKPEHAEAA
jgi:transcriptional regulator with XRE-family HTH domain